MQVKKTAAAFLSAVLLLTASGCRNSAGPQQEPENESAQTEPQETAETAEKENDILILYFCADNTKDPDAVSAATPKYEGTASVEWIAGLIQEKTGGDLAQIIPSADYPLVYEELADFAKEEADQDLRPGIEELSVDPSSYKTVFLGYPIWWYTLPKVMETFFDNYDLSGVTIIPFNTHAGSRSGGTWELIQDREPEAVMKEGISIAGEDAGKDSGEKAVLEWLEDLNLE